MAKPILRSTAPGQPQSVQFAHFGVLNDGSQSKASTITSITLNIVIALVVIVVTAATKKISDDHIKLTRIDAPIPIKKEEPPKPPPPPVKPPPPLPEVPKIVTEPPKIKLPDVKIPDPPKVPVVKMETKPVILPTVAPLKVVATAAPAVVNLSKPAPASVQNNLTRSSAVALGRTDSPVAPSNAPAVNTPVNLGRGVPGMNAANTGAGQAGATKLSLGSGSPNGSVTGTRAVAVVGLPTGQPNGTGTAPRGATQPIQLAQAQQPAPAKQMTAQSLTQASGPTVVSKPKPEYTAEAIRQHIEGKVYVKIRVTPSGSVEVIGVTTPLGHGLDESAVRAVQGTRFKPAVDAAGNPIPWEGVVSVIFQLAG